MHDDKCEMGVFDGSPFAGKVVIACRCEVRSLEAKLWQQDDLLAMLDEARAQRDDMAKAFVTQGNEYHVACDFKLAAAESRLAALRPLVRACLKELERGCFCMNGGPMAGHSEFCVALLAAMPALDPPLIAWAKGGE